MSNSSVSIYSSEIEDKFTEHKQSNRKKEYKEK